MIEKVFITKVYKEDYEGNFISVGSGGAFTSFIDASRVLLSEGFNPNPLHLDFENDEMETVFFIKIEDEYVLTGYVEEFNIITDVSGDGFE